MRLFAAAALCLALVSPALARDRDARLWTAAEGVRNEQLALLETLVNIDSGTGDVEGGRRVAAVLEPRLKALGMEVAYVPAEAPGLPDNMVATLKGTGRGRILMIGHMDTVFEPGTAAKRPFRIEGERAYGPGVGDEKGGVVQGLMAIKLLKDLGYSDFAAITLLIETSEEQGSPGTRALIARLLKDADVELNLEPGDAPDVLTVWRKGSYKIHIKVKGRASHAGVAPGAGRNAADELIHQLGAAKAFPRFGDGMTLNLTLMSAGARHNIIPEAAEATLNLRVTRKAQVDQVLRAFRARAANPSIPGTIVTVSHDVSFPPLERNPGTDALADQATAIYAELGRKLGRGGNGGASESALAWEAGVPALDGLGPINNGAHSDNESIELESLTPRLYLLTRLLMDLGRTPPGR